MTIKMSSRAVPSKPSFDQWYEANHMGFSFDAHYMKMRDEPLPALKALARELRKYVSEMVQT